MKNNELLTKNHQAHPTGAKPFPKANAISHNYSNNQGHDRGCGHGCRCYRCHCRGCGCIYY